MFPTPRIEALPPPPFISPPKTPSEVMKAQGFNMGFYGIVIYRTVSTLEHVLVISPCCWVMDLYF